jgi:hypothetical protein
MIERNVFFMKIFKCWFPGCDYCTNSRSKIDFHHIIPKEIDSRPSNKWTVPLCKTHHAMIYVPNAKYGQHSIKVDDSLIIKHVYDSTCGKTVHFESMDGNAFYYNPETKDKFI